MGAVKEPEVVVLDAVEGATEASSGIEVVGGGVDVDVHPLLHHLELDVSPCR